MVASKVGKRVVMLAERMVEQQAAAKADRMEDSRVGS